LIFWLKISICWLKISIFLIKNFDFWPNNFGKNFTWMRQMVGFRHRRQMEFFVQPSYWITFPWVDELNFGKQQVNPHLMIQRPQVLIYGQKTDAAAHNGSACFAEKRGIFLHQFFTPKFLLFYTNFFYTKILAFFTPIFVTPKFFLFLHQFFLHQKFCFFTPNF